MNIVRAQIELSSRCNFKCITCKHGYCEYGQDLPVNICNMLIENVLPNLKVLELQGTGESLLNAMTEKFIAAAHENNTDIVLITNGSLLTEKIMYKLILAGTQIIISLDGSNEEIYHMHRPIGNFETVIKNIQRLSEIRCTVSSTTSSIVVNMVLTKLNYSDITNMIKLLSKIGVDFLFVSEVRECMPNVNVWNRLNLLSESSTLEFKSMILSCKELAQQKGIGFAFNYNIQPNGIKKTICEAPWKHIFISSNGDVSFCCELSKSFGNLRNQNLLEILSCKDAEQFRNDMIKGNYNKTCLNCCLPWGLTHF